MSTFEKVLFPTDFSSQADHALQRALEMLPADNREVIVQHVVRSYFEKHSHWTTLFDIHEMQKYVDMHVDSEMARIIPKDSGAGVRFRSTLSEGRPAQQITELAEKEKVDLIVMGPAKGAVTGHVIRAASCPVLSIPASNTGNGKGTTAPVGKLSKILIATDLSPQSRTVVNYGFKLKQLFGCELYLFHAIELTDAVRFGIRQGHFSDAPSKMRTWAENQLKNLTPHEHLSDPSVHRIIEEGPAIDKVKEAAETYGADLIMFGTHGYGPVQKHFVGTTTDRALTRLSRPMLTVKV